MSTSKPQAPSPGAVCRYGSHFTAGARHRRWRHSLDRTCSIQEMCAKAGKHHLELDEGEFEQLARDAGADLPAERVVARPGEAISFDGRLWHASVNESSSTRRAPLLQYATPDSRILTPIPGNYCWPFEEADRRARCVLVRGRDNAHVNEVVPPPAGTFGRRAQIGSLPCRCPAGCYVAVSGCSTRVPRVARPPSLTTFLAKPPFRTLLHRCALT